MSAPDRTVAPPGGTLRPFDFPSVVRCTLPSGLDLRVAEVRRLPMVALNLFIRAGEAALGEERAGLAVLTADALEGGTKKRSGSDLAEAVERIGARISTHGGWEGTTIGLSCLAERLPEALTILSELLLDPAFPEDEVARVRDQQLATIRQRAMNPGSLATDTARARYFDPSVPYARSVDGSVASVGAATVAAMRGWVEAAFRPENGGLVVAGDVDPAEVESMVREHLGRWTGVPAVRADFTAEPASRERSVVLVHRPGAVQSELRVGHVGAPRSIPDYYPLSIANMVLGGMFTSRLNLNLREKNGFTYGVRSRFAFRSQAGPFQVSTAVGNDVTAPAVREIVRELEGIATDGPTEDEVAAARDYAAGVFGLHLQTTSQIADRVGQLVVFGLPDDHFDRYRDDVRSVTRAQAAESAARWIRPAEAQIVVVGDAEVVADPLRALELGPVEVEEG